MQKTIFRSGKVSNKVSIKVDTVDGTANEGSDYRGIHEVFTMEPHQTELPIQVEIGEIGCKQSIGFHIHGEGTY